MADTEPAALTPLVPEDHASDEMTLIRPPANQGHADFGSTDLPIDFDHEPTTTPQAFAPTAEAPMDSAHGDLAIPHPSSDEVPFEVSDFDLEPEVTAPSAPVVHHAEAPASGHSPSIDFDFGDLSLDLDKPSAAAAAHAVETAELPELDMGAGGESEPMARKIELADEFRRIGDHEGARELLEEVVSKAEGPLKTRAQTMLDALG